MAIRGMAEPTKHNPPLYIYIVISPSTLICLIMVAYSGHILESTKGIEIKLGTYIDVNEMKYQRQEP